MSVFDLKKILRQKRERRTLSEMLMSASGHTLSNTPRIRKERIETGTIFVLLALVVCCIRLPRNCVWKVYFFFDAHLFAKSGQLWDFGDLYGYGDTVSGDWNRDLQNGSTTLGTGTISNGQATFSSSKLALGSQSITASYGGNTNYASSTSTVLTETVNQANTAITLSSSANPSTYGSSVKFTATVTPSAATGTVTFKDGSTTLGTGTISGGKVTFSSSTLALGSHSITASYGGATDYSGSTSSVLTQTVNQVSTSVTLASSANPSAFDSSVKFTATVTPTAAAGTVTFADGGTTLGTGTISGGKTTFSIATLAAGSHSITASYGGGTDYRGSISSTLTQTVNKANTTVTLASSANPSGYASSVTFTAKVTPSAATGTVTFTDGSTTLGTGTISNGEATYSTSTLAVGSHSITAAYSGDPNDNSSTSSTLTQTVKKATTSTALSSSSNPSTYGSPVTFTVTVTPSTATGTVTFKNGSTTLGTATISDGNATYSTSALAVGSHSITAAYGGDTNDNSSTSSTLSQTVNKVNTTVTANFVGEPIGIWVLGEVHGHGDTGNSDWDGNVRRWDHNSRNGDDQQRERCI